MPPYLMRSTNHLDVVGLVELCNNVGTEQVTEKIYCNVTLVSKLNFLNNKFRNKFAECSFSCVRVSTIERVSYSDPQFNFKSNIVI